jgi:hypothetical protein
MIYLQKGPFEMSLFDPDNRTRSPRHKKIYALCEIAYTVVDVSAAVLFVVGSILFFYPKTTDVGIWFFLIGSVFFGLRPTIKLAREFAYLRIGDYTDVADSLK